MTRPPMNQPALPVSHHRRVAHAAKGPERGQQMHRLEQVSFALRIAAEEHVKARLEVGIEPAVVSKIPQSQMRQVHGALWGLGRQCGNQSGEARARGGRGGREVFLKTGLPQVLPGGGEQVGGLRSHGLVKGRQR